MVDEEGWPVYNYAMFQHRHEEQILAAVVHMLLAKQLAPPSTNVSRLKGRRAARRRNAATRKDALREADNNSLQD